MTEELKRCATVVSDWLAGGCDVNNIPRPHIATLAGLVIEILLARTEDKMAHDTPPEIELESDALRDIASERRRQIDSEGWTLVHDDKHTDGELSLAAAGYAMAASDQIQAVAHEWDNDSSMEDFVSAPTAYEPWPNGWEFKKCTPRQALVKAGALILAEIERIDRMHAAGSNDDAPQTDVQAAAGGLTQTPLEG